MTKLDLSGEFIAQQANSERAISFLIQSWESLGDTEKASWKTNSVYEKDLTGRGTFVSYFIATFAELNTADSQFNTVALSDGTSASFADRATRDITAS